MSREKVEALCERAHNLAVDKGWVTHERDPRSYFSLTNLFHSELSEAEEEYRNNRRLNEVYYEHLERLGRVERDIGSWPRSSAGDKT